MTTNSIPHPTVSPRSRWRDALWLCTGAALTAAAAVVMTSAWSADAAPGDRDATFVPTAGCRLLDTRSGPDNIGNRNVPLGADETHRIPVHGDNGDCTGDLAIPADATAIAINATAVGATSASNIRLYPADLEAPPLLSNLNVTAGAPATPNKVDVQLSPDGAITAYNFKGRVDLVIDVVGYYTTATLSELHQRVAQLEAATGATDPSVGPRLDQLEASALRRDAAIDALDAAQPFSVTKRDAAEELTRSDETVVAVTLTAPVDGHVTANSTTVVRNDTGESSVLCSLTTGDAFDEDYEQWAESPGAAGDKHVLAGTRRFEASAGSTVTVNLVCKYFNTFPTADSAQVTDSVLTAIFTPAN